VDRATLLERIKLQLTETFGDRLKGVVLYGSEVRRESEPDSDIDVLVLLDGDPLDPQDSWACINALYPLALELERPIHAEPVNEAEYAAGEYPLYRSAQREGIRI
jgi:uncharacterized protein